ncbi:amino acid permease [Edwardsiella ictaluri]|uniref:Lysine-specific permease, putative n=1 Tax=Edwardsiella ictaluri (strain 93-146) TaxID=634503 RepID=C5BCN6_EDWI9|nr:amino acid permease [Edwardsiella ictaluri]ACR68491.2 lysine-specific permease, putative [Edwardsiella ictaluri 93-146]ARD40799.1 lysine transporter [Edwardsiella ictaluri]AVZ81183.1 amino acid permease [Edwardsiella ictaluri]EKS7763796.1 amino acid permease [Edwardsiella ictaluri]EKS7770578.1 amino acid permease [Edwardsiella ictaluri]
MAQTKTTVPDAGQGPALRRELKARHLSMIAIGGSIGTGLFVASGATVSQAGPGGALLSYIIIGMMVYFLMTSLGELAAFMPVSGSFSTYGSRYVEEGFGFALGWNYWYNWAVTIAVDLVAAQLVMGYWFPDMPGWIWSALFLCLIFLLNYISVKGFGEAEYWFSLIKVSTVIIFIAVGLMMIAGILKGGEGAGFHNWTIGDAPFAGGFASMIGVAMIVGFSFQGTELIGIAAGESKDPGKNIPMAVRQVFWRILLFYVFAILIISLLIPYTDPSLLRNDVKDISVSPFTLVFKNAGLLSAAAVMNAVILTAVLSAGNSGMYASTRMLYTLATEGKAPRIFGRLSKGGVPRNALYATTVVAGLCFLTSMFGNQEVYLWLLNTSGMTGFIAWLGIAISHYRFRRGYVMAGLDLNALPYKSGFFPLGPIFAFVLCLIITLGQNYEAFLKDRIDWYGVTATYIGLPLFLIIWFGYKLTQGTRFVRYSEMTFPTTKVD